MSGDADYPPPRAWDFDSLRRLGLETIQRVAGAAWTDHNAHDPGITLLEQLSYALTDLGYRAGYDVRDLLAGGGGDVSLFSPSQILTANPVTLLDLRKLVLDVDGVKNAWIEPVTTPTPRTCLDAAADAIALDAPPPALPVPLRGLYRVLVAPDSAAPNPAAISQRLNAARPLGLDFLTPEVMQEQKVAVIAEVEISHTHVPSELLRVVHQAVADFISPRIRFHSLDEMLARGLTLDQIFEGPLLRHGFIDDEELERASRVPDLHTSDLLAVLMQTPGVSAVHRIALQKRGGPEEPWVLPLEPSETPAFDPANSRITLVRGRIAWTPPKEEIARVTQARSLLGKHSDAELAKVDPTLPTGTDRHPARYRSLQHDLPMIYGLGSAGLPVDATPERRAQVRQLRAYLMLFEQVLANCFRQVGRARELFSFEPIGAQSYFAQMADDVPYAAEILKPGFDLAALQKMVETPEVAAAREQRFVSHLLARFAEDFGGSVLQGKVLRRTHAERLESQRDFLRDYPAVSGGLGRGFDYTRPSWGDAHRANVSGLEKRVAAKLGLTRYRRHALADLPATDPGGFHLVEHILLRPGREDSTGGLNPADPERIVPPFLARPLNGDPYSAQLSFVFPDWIAAFGTLPDAKTKATDPLRDFVEKTVRDETPAHLRVHVRWLSREEMIAFEPAYRTWLASMVTIL